MAGDKDFGKHLKKLRESRGLSQDKLAEMVGLEYQTISRIETGMYFTNFENLRKIADALNVSLKDLFDYQENNLTSDELKKLIKQVLNSSDKNKLEVIYKIIKVLEV